MSKETLETTQIALSIDCFAYRRTPTSHQWCAVRRRLCQGMPTIPQCWMHNLFWGTGGERGPWTGRLGSLWPWILCAMFDEMATRTNNYAHSVVVVDTESVSHLSSKHWWHWRRVDSTARTESTVATTATATTSDNNCNCNRNQNHNNQRQPWQQAQTATTTTTTASKKCNNCNKQCCKAVATAQWQHSKLKFNRQSTSFFALIISVQSPQTTQRCCHCSTLPCLCFSYLLLPSVRWLSLSKQFICRSHCYN